VAAAYIYMSHGRLTFCMHTPTKAEMMWPYSTLRGCIQTQRATCQVRVYCVKRFQGHHMKLHQSGSGRCGLFT
jgi:hypothetical protein